MNQERKEKYNITLNKSGTHGSPVERLPTPSFSTMNTFQELTEWCERLPSALVLQGWFWQFPFVSSSEQIMEGLDTKLMSHKDTLFSLYDGLS